MKFWQIKGQIARLGNRVLMSAKNEADNSEDPQFVRRVNDAASTLHSGFFITIIFAIWNGNAKIIFFEVVFSIVV